MNTVIAKVDAAFIKQRDENALRYKGSSKEKTDCEFLEYALNRMGASGYSETNEWWSDSEHVDYGKVDFKCQTPGKPWYNVTTRSLQQPVDHYIAWKWVDKPKRILQEGDIVKMEIVAIHTKQYVKNNIRFKNNPDMGFVML